MSTVKAVLGDGQPLTAAITKDAAADLDLAPGDAVVVDHQVDRGDRRQGARASANNASRKGPPCNSAPATSSRPRSTPSPTVR